MQTILKLFSTVKNNSNLILVGGLFLLALLYSRECNRSARLEKEKIEAITIAENNAKAIKDSTIELKVTREQLALYDTELDNLVRMNDSLLGETNKVKTVTVFKFVDRTPSITVDNNISYNDTNELYELSFVAEDSLKKIGGVSRFGIDTLDYTLFSSTTTINEFRLKYGFMVSRYDDNIENVSRVSILPVYLNSDGSLSNRIVPETYLDITMRGVELLDVPYRYNRSELNQNKRGWAVGISPISLGYFYTPQTNTMQIGIGPSVSVVYYFHL